MNEDRFYKISGTIFIAIILIICFVKIFHVDEAINDDKLMNKSWEYICIGDYKQAREVLKDVKTTLYDGTVLSRKLNFILDFRNMCMENDKGDYKAAHRYMDALKNPQEYKKGDNILNKKQWEFVNKKLIEVEENYNAHKAEYRAEELRIEAEWEKRRQEREAEEERKKQEAPYVGMSESKINSTDLGACSKYIEHFNTETVNGKVIHCSMYYWKTSAGYIYSARCGNGKVLNVDDYRSAPIEKTVSEQYDEIMKKYESKNKDKYDPDDHDIEQYYLDYKDSEGFESIDDAMDDFEDNPEYWDEY